ncbi:MAG: ORF6N domain-containing protein [Ruminococcus sp.]|nr:ORF6N domain-containing protein [Ruminococcus sp.]
MYELINNKYIKIKEYNGQRVVTFRDIDTVHERPEGTARKRFNDNKEHFIEGVDYFKICASEIRTHKIMDISPKTHEDIILLTESGYLMIVKSFTDDLAWSIQRMLVNTYFMAQQKQSDEKYAGISKADIVDELIFQCEKHNEQYLALNQKIDIVTKENYKFEKENRILKKEISRLKKRIGELEKYLSF